MKYAAAIVLLALSLTACGEDAGLNPPTEPADPIQGVTETVPGAEAAATTAQLLPGAGPVSFVGRWSSNRDWCARPQADQRPIEITTTRFEGYENGCDLLVIDQVEGAYEATRRCTSEGATTTDRVRMAVNGETLTLTYLDQPGVTATTLLKCPVAETTGEP